MARTVNNSGNRGTIGGRYTPRDFRNEYQRQYGKTANCKVLDAQIDAIGDKKNLIYQNRISGDKRAIKDILVEKEILFGNLDCKRKLEQEFIHGNLDILNERFEEDEEAIIGESNIKRNTMLIGGGVVLLIALAIFIE